MIESTPGIVVTYFPAGDFAARLAGIVRETSSVIVADNTTDAHARENVRRITAEAGAEWLPQDGNRGTGGGLNAGFALLADRGHATAVAFDQDSIPGPGCIAALRKAAGERPRTAVVGSNWRDAARPEVPSRHLVGGAGFRPWFRRAAAEVDLDDVAFVISSGSLFDLVAWRELGGFREDLFLDLVDTEYCLRARAAGWRVRVAADAVLQHNRGAKQPVRRFGRTWWPAFMPPERVRLVVRNRVWLILRHGWTRWPWTAFEMTHTAFLLFSAIVLENNRRAKTTAVLLGLLDGMRCRLGPPPKRAEENDARPAM
jgi:rhamnosyltransferase